MNRRIVGPATLLAGLLLPALVVAGEAEAEYSRRIKPLLRERCFACHGALKQESGLRLDTVDQMRRGGDSGPVLVPGQPARSPLVERIEADESAGRMPPEGPPLTAEQIGWIRAWIQGGAVGLEDERPEADPSEHWAFRVPVRPPRPDARGAAGRNDGTEGSGTEGSGAGVIQAGGNPIDAFVLAQLRERGLRPRPAAEKQVLLRRVYLDLVGVPPTRGQLRAFLADNSPDAWNRVVDRLLNDPRYGQRWARHWMDVWRYSDWYGRRNVGDVRNSAPQIWRWRDWIVQSLNRDKGYDRMVAEMLAADEICPEDRQAGYATGYLIRNWYALNPNDWMRANVEHTGKAFLGLTFNCAHCHDHKYDPISQDNYFQFRAFFEPMYIRQERVPGQADPGKFVDYTYGASRKVQPLGAVRIFDQDPDAPTWFYTGGDERNRIEQRGSIPPGLPDFLCESPLELEPVQLPPRAWYPGLQPEIQRTERETARAAVERARQKLAAVRESSREPSPAARQRLAAAVAAYEAAELEARESGRGGALVGSQSLVLDAREGRRIVQNPGRVQQLESLPDGSQFEFELLIQTDAHVNFQLARDIVKGLTASFVAFDKGRIIAYQPGGFTEFEAGRYDFAAGQRRFHVRLVLRTAEDRCLLTVRSVTDGQILAESVPVALNGWNPVGDATKAITLDARPGSLALVDQLTLTAAAGTQETGTYESETQETGSQETGSQETGTRETGTRETGQRLLTFDFEPPAFRDGQDVAGREGFVVSSWSVPPARSYVSATAGNERLRTLAQAVEAARGELRRASLPREVAESEYAAAEALRMAVEARIAADRARFGEASGGDPVRLAAEAARSEREADCRRAEARVLAAELALLEAEAKAVDDPQRAKQMEAAGKALAEARAMLEAAITARETELSAREAGLAAREAGVAGREAGPAGPEQGTVSGGYTPFSPLYPKTSTGRRRALAAWITSRRNPLTARVAVNHVWARHFHAPLVASVYDFGRNGSPPSHPRLLDWLAVELMENNWSMKHLHRLIVTSDAYRRSSGAGADARNLQLDPDNRSLWRMNTGRMESEVLRDSLLFVADQLDLAEGGPPLDNGQALTTHRRSLYYEVYPEDGGADELSVLFDAPNPLDCYRRTTSVIPQQALALTNSELVHRLSEAIVSAWEREDGKSAERLASGAEDAADDTQDTADDAADNAAEDAADDRFLVAMFERILSRAPSEAERQICRQALDRQRRLLARANESASDSDGTSGASTDVGPSQLGPSQLGPSQARKVRASLVRALLNHNDFVTIR